MKLPRVLRAARAATYAYQNPSRAIDSLNRGFYSDPNHNMPDAMRGSSSRMNHTQAEVDAIVQAAANSPRRRG